jgi:hypothetical protein
MASATQTPQTNQPVPVKGAGIPAPAPVVFRDLASI